MFELSELEANNLSKFKAFDDLLKLGYVQEGKKIKRRKFFLQMLVIKKCLHYRQVNVKIFAL